MPEQQATLPTWARVLAASVGGLSIAAAFVVLRLPGLALLTLVPLLGIALLFIGLDRVIAGISAHRCSWVAVFPIGPADPSNSTPGAPSSPL
jgi:uncharacterized membrane protein HdeD (DUF308 family)